MPQLWCLYKEVMDYYAQGLRPPADITLLWTDDNWGNLRRLPTAAERARSGGAGIYYHFDYHGGPRNYQWINTSPLAKVAEQMSLAKDLGADRIWIVNVGHLKGYEIPTEYFLRLGWNTTQWTPANTRAYTQAWAAREFGEEHAVEIADIVVAYTRINGRVKPELLTPQTYSAAYYSEAELVLAEYSALLERARQVADGLPTTRTDSFYELVLFPVAASQQVNEIYISAAKNILFAQQGRASAEQWAERVHSVFRTHITALEYFNTGFLDGRWNHFQDQFHIGYTSWSEAVPQSEERPTANSLSVIEQSMRRVQPAAGPSLGVAAESSVVPATAAGSAVELPLFDSISQRTHYFEVFNRGSVDFRARVSASAPWVLLNATALDIGPDSRVLVSVDWAKMPTTQPLPGGFIAANITVSGGVAGTATVALRAFVVAHESRSTLSGLMESDGVVSALAEHAELGAAVAGASFQLVPDYGATGSAIRTVAGPCAAAISLACGMGGPSLKGQQACSSCAGRAQLELARASCSEADITDWCAAPPRAQFRMFLQQPPAAAANVTVALAPALNWAPGRAVRIAVPSPCPVLQYNYVALRTCLTYKSSIQKSHRYCAAQVSVDDETPLLLTVVPLGYTAQNGNRDWEQSVELNHRYLHTAHVFR